MAWQIYQSWKDFKPFRIKREDHAMDEQADSVLDQAEKHLEEGRQREARSLLAGYLKSQPRSERAWWLMSFAVTEQNQKVDCLQRVLAINPDHEDARSRLDSILYPTEPPEFEEQEQPARWEVEPAGEVLEPVEIGFEEEDAVTEDLGEFEAPAGDLWTEIEEEEQQPIDEGQVEWRQELDLGEADPDQERSSLWDDEPVSETQTELESGSSWGEERLIPTTPEREPVEQERAAEPEMGTAGVYQSPAPGTRQEQKKRGRSNRLLLFLVILVFALGAALACGLLFFWLGFFPF
jgi:hypothetical protein